LIEAMGCGRCVLYLDTPENREVAGDVALAFLKSPEALAAGIRTVLEDARLRQECQARSLERVPERYRRDAVAPASEQLFHDYLGRKARGESSAPGESTSELPKSELTKTRP